MAARSSPYRVKLPESIKAKIDDTINRTMYLVQTTGPTNYVIQEQDNPAKYRVLIGSVQSCTCRDDDVCIHILYVMLKILHVSQTNPVLWQKSLIDSEITTLLSGGYSQNDNQRKASAAFLRRKISAPVAVEPVQKESTRHTLVEGEVCAICQEEMVESERNLTYCKYGCGNNFHIECMKVFGESRKQSKEAIICPLCRKDWGETALTELKKEADISNRNPLVHTGTTCKQCQTKPIRCNRYRCLQCKHVDLCERCFKTNAHAKHSFVMRKAHKGTWFPALRTLRDSLLTPSTITELENRELSHADYDLLLELDAAEKYPLQDYLMTNLSGEKLSPVQAKEWTPPTPHSSTWCTLCAQSLKMSMEIRILPCEHTYHESCLLQHLLGQKYHCPNEECTYVLFPGLHHEKAVKKPPVNTLESTSSSRPELAPTGLMNVVSLMKKPDGTIQPLPPVVKGPRTLNSSSKRVRKPQKAQVSNQDEELLGAIVTSKALQAPPKASIENNFQTIPNPELRKATNCNVQPAISSSHLPPLVTKLSLSPTNTKLTNAQAFRTQNQLQKQQQKQQQKLAVAERKQQNSHLPPPNTLRIGPPSPQAHLAPIATKPAMEKLSKPKHFNPPRL